jgi:aminoglycoside 2''-phosphotransferase
MTPAVDAIIRAFPQLEDNRSLPVSIDGGQNALVLDLGTHIARIAHYPGRQPLFIREAAVLEILKARLPLPVPVLSVRHVDGTLVAVHEKLPGNPLLSLSDINASQQRTIAAQLAGFLRSLHEIPVSVLKDADVPVENVTFWAQWLESVRVRIYPLIDNKAAERFDRHAVTFLDNYRDLSFGIKHGDFGSGNILAAEGEIIGIIDFGSVSIGDVASDIAGLAASYGDPFLDMIAETYPEVHAMKPRVAFYRLAFAAMEALQGLEHGDGDALQAGRATLDRSR